MELAGFLPGAPVSYTHLDVYKRQVTRTPLNQYDSVIRPLETYLRKAGVNFRENCEVTDIDFADGPGITVKTLYLKKKVESTDDSGEESDAPAGPSYVTEEVQLNKSDICITVSYTHLDVYKRQA